MNLKQLINTVNEDAGELPKYNHTEETRKVMLDALKPRLNSKDFDVISSHLELFRMYNKSVPKTLKGVLELVFWKNMENQVRSVLDETGFVASNTDKRHVSFTQDGVNVVIRSTGSTECLNKSSNANALGKALADAGERATILSFTKNIETPEDTEEPIFKNNPQIFDNWKATFKYTKEAIEKAIKRPIDNSLKIIHDGAHNSEIAKLFQKIAKRNGWNSKDAWCPADLYLVDVQYEHELIERLTEVVNYPKNNPKRVCVWANSIIEDFAVNKKAFFPISLKQLAPNATSAKIEIHDPKVPSESYSYSIHQFNCNLDPYSELEIGAFVFMNNVTNDKIRMQYRGFPHKWSNSQAEITHDGTETGGRLSKISVNVIDKVLSDYGSYRLRSKLFGAVNVPTDKRPNPKNTQYFTNCKRSDFKDFYKMYRSMKLKNGLLIKDNTTENDFLKGMEEARTNHEIAWRMCHKLQGLKLMAFFAKHENEISAIVQQLITGAKKISKDNCYFIKIM